MASLPVLPAPLKLWHYGVLQMYSYYFLIFIYFVAFLILIIITECMLNVLFQWGGGSPWLLVGPTLSRLSVKVSTRRCRQLCCIQPSRP